jgi:hypothetical protein
MTDTINPNPPTQRPPEAPTEFQPSGDAHHYWRDNVLYSRSTRKPVGHIHDRRWSCKVGDVELHGPPKPMAASLALKLARELKERGGS